MSGSKYLRIFPASILVLTAALAIRGFSVSASDSFEFTILGDRTGEAQDHVYEQVWSEIAAEKPAFVLSVGDTIQGMNDATAEPEWRSVRASLARYRAIPLFLTPGNHDIWSASSEALFRKYAKHPPHYGFDYRQLHVTVLDNSRSEQFSPDEIAFLESDLRTHSMQPLKLIISHRPSWLMQALFSNPNSPFQQIAKKYGVRYVIAGHIHQMLHFELDGISYLSMPSAGGHLRASKRYEDGWFFGHTKVKIHGNGVQMKIEECRPPNGRGRVSVPDDWGTAGLRKKAA
jgi:UDP-2,3-diacylglucosamine pyrophosphatase LpxH